VGIHSARKTEPEWLCGTHERTYREDVLDAYLSQNLEEAQELTEEWMMMYNGQRPHEALGNLTPYEYAIAIGT
jgi:transposase InsO family protein